MWGKPKSCREPQESAYIIPGAVLFVKYIRSYSCFSMIYCSHAEAVHCTKPQAQVEWVTAIAHNHCCSNLSLIDARNSRLFTAFASPSYSRARSFVMIPLLMVSSVAFSSLSAKA